MSVLTGLALFSGCKHEDALPQSCSDVSGLTKDEVETRTALGYADASRNPAQVCEGCLQYVAAPRSGACGSCKLLKGPIHPKGFCRSFTAKS